MRLGIFAKTFPRASVEATLGAVRAHGLDATQFNLSVCGLPSLPERIPEPLAAGVRAAAHAQGVGIAAVSGTFNMAHPDDRVRAGGLRRLEVLAAACRGLGTTTITLCTGTRDAHDMWRRHPDNATPEAWEDLRATVLEAVAIAERHAVVLAFEPELATVVDGAPAARRLLDEVRSPRLKVVIDAANLFDAGDPARRLSRSEALLTEAFERLGDDIVLAHAKDVTVTGAFAPAGQGDVDWPLYLALLERSGYDGPLILHGLEESDVTGSVAFLRGPATSGGARAGGP